MTTANSGRPYIQSFTATTTATTFNPPVITKFAQIRNEGAVTVDLYFDSADVGTAENALTLAATGSTGDYFEGPMELYPGADPTNPTRGGITLQAASSTAEVRCVFYQEGPM